MRWIGGTSLSLSTLLISYLVWASCMIDAEQPLDLYGEPIVPVEEEVRFSALFFWFFSSVILISDVNILFYYRRKHPLLPATYAFDRFFCNNSPRFLVSFAPSYRSPQFALLKTLHLKVGFNR